MRGPEPAATATATGAVCVLGMSRSGTSLTARLLGLGGVDFGREGDLLAGGDANPGGLWEHVDFLVLNELILKRLGGTWDEPPELPPGWQRDERLSALREEARVLVERFAGSDPWGWKDPRNCLTLPFWQELLPPMRYVLCLRNPLDVAASLGRRNDMPAGRALALWRDYVTAALRHTAQGPRVVVSYEEYFEDWRAPVARMAQLLGGGETLGEDLDGRLEAAIVAEHRHHSTPPGDLGRDPRVPAEVLSLYREALACAASS